MKTYVCQGCNKNFSEYYEIEGKRIRLIHRKYCLECSPFNQFKMNKGQNKTKNIGDKRECAYCNRLLLLDRFNRKGKNNHNHHSYCKQCMLRINRELKKKFKDNCIKYKGGKCEHCGYDKCYAALEFHHIDPTKKDFWIAQGSKIFTYKIKLELDKCKLLCSNCHREEHIRLYEKSLINDGPMP